MMREKALKGRNSVCMVLALSYEGSLRISPISLGKFEVAIDLPCLLGQGISQHFPGEISPQFSGAGCVKGR